MQHMIIKKNIIRVVCAIVWAYAPAYAVSWDSFYKANKDTHWTQDDVRHAVGFDEKQALSGEAVRAYANHLQTYASALYAQDRILALTHDITESFAAMDAADALLRARMGPKDSYQFSPQSYEAVVESLVYRDLICTADILEVRSEQKILDAIARMKQSSNKEVLWMVGVIEEKLHFSVNKRRSQLLSDEINNFMPISDWWIDFFKKPEFQQLRCKNNIHEKFSYWSRLISDGRKLELQRLKAHVTEVMRFQRQRNQSARVVADYEGVRAIMQDRYSAFVTELARLIAGDASLREYAFLVYDQTTQLPGIDSACAASSVLATSGATVDIEDDVQNVSLEKKKHKKHKKKKNCTNSVSTNSCCYAGSSY